VTLFWFIKRGYLLGLGGLNTQRRSLATVTCPQNSTRANLGLLDISACRMLWFRPIKPACHIAFDLLSARVSCNFYGTFLDVPVFPPYNLDVTIAVPTRRWQASFFFTYGDLVRPFCSSPPKGISSFLQFLLSGWVSRGGDDHWPKRSARFLSSCAPSLLETNFDL